MALFDRADMDNILKGSTKASVASSRFVTNAIRKSFRNNQMLRSTQEFSTDDLVDQLKQVANDALRLEKALGLLRQSDPKNGNIKNYRNLLDSLNSEKASLSRRLNEALASREVANNVVQNIARNKTPLRRGTSSNQANRRTTLGGAGLNVLGAAINVAGYINRKRGTQNAGSAGYLTAGGGPADPALARQSLKISRDTYARDTEFQEKFKKDYDNTSDKIIRRLDKMIDKLDRLKGSGGSGVGGGNGFPDIDLPDGEKKNRRGRRGGRNRSFGFKAGLALKGANALVNGAHVIDSEGKDQTISTKNPLADAFQFLTDPKIEGAFQSMRDTAREFIGLNAAKPNTSTTTPSTAPVAPPATVIPPNQNFAGLPQLPRLNTMRPLSVLGGGVAPGIRTNETDIDVKPQATVIINTRELEIKGVAGAVNAPVATVGSNDAVLGGLGGGIGSGGVYSGSGAGTGAIIGSRSGSGGQAFTPQGTQRQSITSNAFGNQPVMTLPSDVAGAGTAGGGIANPYGFAGMGAGGLSAGNMGSASGLPGNVTSQSITSASGQANIGQGGQYRPVYNLGQSDLSDEVVRTIAGEARMGDPKSVDAVIHTMMNRLGSKGYGASGNLAEVAAAPEQFAAYNKGRPTAEQAEMIRSRIKEIASGKVPDITGGANEFRTQGYSGPWGQKHAADGQTIGGNTFAKNPNAKGTYQSYDKPIMGNDPDSTAGSERAPGDPRSVDSKKLITANDPMWSQVHPDLAKYKNSILGGSGSGTATGNITAGALQAADAVFRKAESEGVKMTVATGGGSNQHSRNHGAETGEGESIDIKPAGGWSDDSQRRRYAETAATAGANRIGYSNDGHGMHVQNSVGTKSGMPTMSWNYGAPTDMQFRKDLQSGVFTTPERKAELDKLYPKLDGTAKTAGPIYDPTKTFGDPSKFSSDDTPMAEAAGPMSLEQMNNLSPWRDQKNKPTSWYQDPETRNWKPMFNGAPNPGTGTAAGAGFSPSAEGFKPQALGNRGFSGVNPTGAFTLPDGTVVPSNIQLAANASHANVERNLDGTYGPNHSPTPEGAGSYDKSQEAFLNESKNVDSFNNKKEVALNSYLQEGMPKPNESFKDWLNRRQEMGLDGTYGRSESEAQKGYNLSAKNDKLSGLYDQYSNPDTALGKLANKIDSGEYLTDNYGLRGYNKNRDNTEYTPNATMSLDEIRKYAGPNASTDSSSAGATRQSAAPPVADTPAPNPSDSGGGGGSNAGGNSSKQSNPAEDQKAVGEGTAPTISEIPVKNDELGLSVLNSYDL